MTANTEDRWYWKSWRVLLPAAEKVAKEAGLVKRGDYVLPGSKIFLDSSPGFRV